MQLVRLRALSALLALVTTLAAAARVFHLFLAARRAGCRHRPPVVAAQRSLKPAGGVAARADVGREDLVLACGAADLVHPIDELLAVVDPGDAVDWFAAHHRQRTVHHGEEHQLERAAGRASSGDQPVQRELIEKTHVPSPQSAVRSPQATAQANMIDGEPTPVTPSPQMMMIR